MCRKPKPKTFLDKMIGDIDPSALDLPSNFEQDTAKQLAKNLNKNEKEEIAREAYEEAQAAWFHANGIGWSDDE